MLADGKYTYALTMWTVEKRPAGWYFSKSAYHGDKHEWRGPYASDPADIDLLIGAIEPHESPWISTVIGVRGPIAPPDFGGEYKVATRRHDILLIVVAVDLRRVEPAVSKGDACFP